MMKRERERYSLFAVLLILCLLIYPVHAYAASVKTPTISSATVTSDGKVKVSWEKVSDAKGYGVYRSSQKSGTFKLLKTISKNSTVKYTDGAVSPNRTYYYKVRAYTLDGEKKKWSSYSSSVKAKIPQKIKTGSQDDEAAALSDMVRKYTSEDDVIASAADPYASKRLIIKAKTSKLNLDEYNPVAIIQTKDNYYFVQFSSSKAARSACKKIQKLTGVVYAEPDSISVLQGMRDDDTIYPEIPEVESSAYNEGKANEFIAANAMSWGTNAINAAAFAQAIKKKGSGSVTVAVVDTGVYAHVLLENRLVNGYDFVNDDSNPTDENGHGTHVAGTITDCTPGLTVRIMPVRVLGKDGSGWTSIIAQGVRYAADHGAKVINLSLGGGHDSYLDEAINYAISKNVVVVVAAGNDSTDCKYACPAHIPDALTVSATTSSDNLAWFSNYGSAIDVSAPGDSILSTAIGGGYVYMSGTSMAAPHVSAAAAMYRLAYPSYDQKAISNLVKKNALDLGSSGWDQYFGSGRIKLPSSVGSQPPSNVLPQKLSLSKTSATMSTGDTLKLSAAITPVNASNKTITWSSSKSSVASVNNGTVFAKAKGTATITAKTANGIKATCKINVKADSSKGTIINLSPISEYASSSKIKKSAKTVKKGTSLIRGKYGFIQFKVPQTKKYTFTFSGFKSLGSASADKYTVIGVYENTLSYTEGYIYLAQKPYATNTWPAKNSCFGNLKKGDVVYFYLEMDDNNKMQMTLNIK